ncbi:MAG: class I SAM-dependent methyltransferase [Litorivicinaceae bacterium]|jgi:16S rRNA (guanine1516-N2)-methyltransferase|nr:class I SAM-dependent methyltransferase [Litorivicinaceae bacterium]
MIGVDDSGQVLSRADAESAWPWLTVHWQLTPPEQGCYVQWMPDDGLSLKSVESGDRSSLRVDYQRGPQARRIHAVTGELLTRALGCQQGRRPAIFDATFGIGHDSTVLANVGCYVSGCESNPIVAALAADGLRRSVNEPWINRIQFQYRDALSVLPEVPSGVIYIDPMFQERRRAAPSMEMQFMHRLMPNAARGDSLLEAALTSGAARIVVKRSPKAPVLAGRVPSTMMHGKAVRFDIYPLRKVTPEDCQPWWIEQQR